MITWMQTHKKWLIVTIWIATIAFVGAGFVGWGAYSYGKKQDEVAKVKDTPVTVNDVQLIYNQIFNEKNKELNGKLDNATAKKLGIEKAAYKQAILNAMIMQFAKDNGLYITDQEVANTIALIDVFQKNGKFDINTYKTYLKNNNLTPKTFESNLRKDILIQKIMSALSLKSTNTLQDTLASYTFMADDISIKTLNAPEVSATEKEIKEYWEKNKEKYKSIISYDIGIYYVKPEIDVSDNEIEEYYNNHKLNYTDANGKILTLDETKEKVKKDLIAKKTKKTAILTMKKLKHNELNFDIKKDVNFSNSYLSQEIMYKLILKKFIKPTYTEKGWLIAKLIKINKPQVLSYEKAKKLVKEDVLSKKRKEALIKLAKENLNRFEGKNIGFVTKNDVLKLQELSATDAEYFLSNLFNSNKNKDYVLLPQINPTKVILYQIKKQKLITQDLYEKYKNLIIMLSDKLKNNQLNKNLVKQLENLYRANTKVYIKL